MATTVQNEMIPAKKRVSTRLKKNVLAELKTNENPSKSTVKLKEQVVPKDEAKEEQPPMPPAKPKRSRLKRVSENFTASSSERIPAGTASTRGQRRTSVASEASGSPQPKKNNKNRLQSNNANNNNNNNNNYKNNNYIDKEHKEDLARRCEMLKALCITFGVSNGEEQRNVELNEKSYTHAELTQFLANSSIKDTFPFACTLKSNTQLLQRLSSAIYDLTDVQLDQLLDLYHLAFMMQNYRERTTLCMGHRSELLQAVTELSGQLQPEHIEFIGISLCDRFVLGTGNGRMLGIVAMQRALVLLINDGDAISHRIAMTTLLATFAKISGIAMTAQRHDIASEAFKMARRVDWMQLIVDGRDADLFVLVRTFALIINSHQNRAVHADWDRGLGSEIHKFFMQVLRTVRFSSNYNAFSMMVERYIAFCVVRGATASVVSTDVFDTGSL